MVSLALFVGLVVLSVVLVGAGLCELITASRLLSKNGSIGVGVCCLSFGLAESLIVALGGSVALGSLAGLLSLFGAVLFIWVFRLRLRNQESVIWRQRLSVLSQLAAAGVAAGSDVSTAIHDALRLPGDRYWRDLQTVLFSESRLSRSSHSTLYRRLHGAASEWEVVELSRLADIVSVSDSGGSSKNALRRYSESLSRSVGADAKRYGVKRSQVMLLPVGLLFVAFAVLLIVLCIQLISGLSV